MPFMQVTKQERELLDYIRKMEAVDVMDVGRLLKDAAEEILKQSYVGNINRSRRFIDFGRLFMESNKKYRELGE